MNDPTIRSPLQFADAVRIARGCVDYGGGYRQDAELYEAYQNGIATVINALQYAERTGLDESQVRALHGIGGNIAATNRTEIEMNTNHSPGPWAVTDGHYPCFREVRGASFRISVVMSASDLTEDDYRRRSADLKLIAAAPLLLDALRQWAAAEEADDERELVNARASRDAAIAAAT